MGRAFAQPERSSSIAGRVVNSVTGAPLHRATVEITLEGRDDVRGQAGTEGDGQFLLRALPAGRYRISVTRPGYAPMNYGARRPDAPGQIITLGANENKSGLIIRLPALGEVSGTITGLSAAAMNPTVTARPVEGTISNYFGRGGTVDRSGDYQIDGLIPGRYRLSVGYTVLPRLELFPANANVDLNRRYTSYYPSTLNFHEAVLVEIKPGDELAGFNIAAQVPAEAMLGIRILWPKDVAIPKPAPGTSLATLILQTRPTGILEDLYVGGQSIMAGDERPVYRSLVPGRYTLSGTVQLQGRCYSAREEVSAAAGAPTVELPLQPCIDLRGRVRISGAPALPAKLTVSLRSLESAPVNLDRSTLQPDGSFVIPGVPAGRWALALSPLPPGGYLKSVTLGKLDVLDQPFLISPATPARLDILIGANGAEVSGHVQEGIATIILAAPDDAAASIPSRYATTSVDEQGNFRLTGLHPGAYRIYAFDDIEPGAWLDANFLAEYRAAGTPVQLKEGPGPAVILRAISGNRPAAKKGAR
ncbi:carboxypeptidase regulatory-like domain-containing protein [Paludibaculum fermentans]|uniref:Carboxypeptidase regulatory-like domain-containing protein n=1 Tax=Paludibaculum fermentans TaxID=1473598 RepID=A0A7S7NQS5_PALFE|nr:carboxypeptidase regulatory-like domain-containing protein [Paludibaculum fermentans]QOY88100.1 carboxypeptidase regulatory-like domain-containing protein [Paludibaculum fermentans]